jgi:hypothetical protein
LAPLDPWDALVSLAFALLPYLVNEAAKAALAAPVSARPDAAGGD